jgi:hypothetical protein
VERSGGWVAPSHITRPDVTNGGTNSPTFTAADNATVIVKVLERQDPAPSDLASGKASLKTELLNERRNRFYASYMNKARERMKVNVNRELIAQLVA